MNKEDIMQLGITEAFKTMSQNIGGPFGAVIVRGNEIIAVSSNHVIANNDPTAHAEIMAIREACKKLRTYDLSGCEIYATGYPCPMCMAAIIWANIKKVYVSGTPLDAEEVGFRDKYIYDFIRECEFVDRRDVLEIIPLDRHPAKMLYKEYVKMNKTIY